MYILFIDLLINIPVGYNQDLRDVLVYNLPKSSEKKNYATIIMYLINSTIIVY